MSSSSLGTLPVEIIYHLFQYLDTSTILFSLRYVCKRFQIIADSYDQYTLDLSSISKTDFDHLCHRLSPKNILSIILTNDIHTPYQIRTFLSRFTFSQFSRLRSLKLIEIEENNLCDVLMHICQCSLKSLSINCSSWEKFSYPRRVHLSSTIAQSKLEKLHLNISYRDLDMISWPPLPTSLKYLRLERCTFQEYCMILRHTINLHRITLTECLMHNADGSIYLSSDTIYPVKLHSLSYGVCFMRMNDLFRFLSCTPALNHMKLMLGSDVSDSVIDGSRWETFIAQKLPLLNKFEFFFDDLPHSQCGSLNIQSYIQSFQTPFWLEQHHWYVSCDYIKISSVIRLYSLPICNPSFTYYTNSKKISCSTLKTTDNQIESTDQVHQMTLDLNDIVEPDDATQNIVRFRQITVLSLKLDGRYPYASLQLLCTIIDLSPIVHLTIQLLTHNFAENSSLNQYLSAVLRHIPTIHTLKITYLHSGEPFSSTEQLCSLIPRSVQHLQISIASLAEMLYILEQLPQLFSVTFCAADIAKYYDDIDRWIELKRPSSLCRNSFCSIHIWLGNTLHDNIEEYSIDRNFSLQS